MLSRPEIRRASRGWAILRLAADEVTRGRLDEQGRGQAPGLTGREPGPGAVIRIRRGADIEADALRWAAASAEGETASPDLPAARGTETDLMAGAAGAVAHRGDLSCFRNRGPHTPT